jgi:Putative prokaryotic signal transducing protein
MWTCPKCSQRVDDHFEICWKCGTSMDGVEDPTFLADREDTPAPENTSERSALPIPDHLVTIASCSLPAEALAIRLKLEDAGIPVFLADEYTVVMDWLLSNAIGGIKVQVAEHDVRKASELLNLDMPDDETDEEDASEQDETEQEPPEEHIQEKPEDY